MRKFFHRHRHLAGYLLIVAVAVLAVELHHWQTTRNINEARHQACHDAEIVSRNQRLVLSYLIDFNRALGNNINELVAARAQVPQVFCR